MKSIDTVINTLVSKNIKNRIIYTGNCRNCGEFFYTYATNYPENCSRSCRFNNKHLTSDGYYGMYVDGKQVRLHRIIYEKAHGPINKNHDIHHIDGNKLNNKLSNLISLSKSEHAKIHGNYNHL